MFRWLRWQLAKRRLASPAGKYPPRHVRLSSRRHRARAEDFPPDTEGYAKLAPVWDEYAGWFVPGYGRFLASAGHHYGQPIQAALDLACGTGLLTRRLARRAESVVGLDASEAMLREARRHPTGHNVRYVRGDFRDFSLDETFDAAVCGSDSLNYLRTPGELTEVFHCVRRHLRPGGLFAFDVLDRRTCQALGGLKVVADVGGERFEVWHFYDADRCVSESRVVFGGAVEGHRRVPIEEGDVRRAAGEAGLGVVEYFSTNPWLYPFSSVRRRHFYVLRRC
jgi:SAM-dependent methyltransferase